MSALPHKYPRTPHLHGSASQRDDHVLTAAQTARLLATPLVGEEKLDGANVGIGFDAETSALAVQNRGHVLGRGEHAQYAPLWPWLAERMGELRAALGTARILFGEWCYARHSIAYDRLPSYFLAFDLYDKPTGAFLDRAALEAACARVGAQAVPVLFAGRVVRTARALEDLVVESRFGRERAEGIYLRRESGGRVAGRWKWVRSDFVRGITDHWRDRPLEPNRLARPARAVGDPAS
jgi:hypothetical protein